MMVRFAWFLLVVLLCSGCGRAPQSESTTKIAQIPTAGSDAAKGDVVNKDADDVPAVAGKAGFTREQTFIASLTIFVLAVFVGFELITKVPPTLHTPLMSGSNAISGITLVGAALMAGNDVSQGAMFLGLVAVILATINVVGGFMVTDRMLAMFKSK